MSQARTRESLSQFLDYLAEKGLVDRGTIQARKASAMKVLGVLDDEEAVDVTSLDLDEVFQRFQNLHGKNYTPQSLVTYRGRLRTAIDDFNAYLNNPMGFRPSVSKERRRGSKPASPATAAPAKREEIVARNPATGPILSANILPVPIRADLTVYIQGLPYDLTEQEARKISAVVTAMALP